MCKTDLLVVDRLALFLVDGLVVGVALFLVVCLAFLLVLGVVHGVVDSVALLLVGSVTLLLVVGLVHGLVNGLVARVTFLMAVPETKIIRGFRGRQNTIVMKRYLRSKEGLEGSINSSFREKKE